MQEKLFKPKHNLCFDTSAFINLRDRYPFRIFGVVWAEMDKLVADECISSPTEVLDELGIYDDDICKWAKAHASIFKNLDETQVEAVRTILKDYPLILEERKERFDADPFVIAYAQVTGAKVVHMERYKNKNEKRPRIPDVCDATGVPHFGLVGFFDEVGWSFSSHR